MLTLLYAKPENLPYGKDPGQPIAIFCPGEMRDWPIRDSLNVHKNETQKAKDHFIWPLLMGAYLAEIKGCAFHFPASFSNEVFHIEDEIRVQITTVPRFIVQRVIPSVVSTAGKKKVLVDLVCSIENPYAQVENLTRLRAKRTLEQSRYWRDFFKARINLSD